MKYCPKCGRQLPDDAVFCSRCGYSVEGIASSEKEESTLSKIAKVFMVIGCVLSGFGFLIPLCWTIPMTVSYFNHVNEGRPVSVGFKVCTLLFVSLVAGILMLCDDDNN